MVTKAVKVVMSEAARGGGSSSTHGGFRGNTGRARAFFRVEKQEEEEEEVGVAS